MELLEKSTNKRSTYRIHYECDFNASGLDPVTNAGQNLTMDSDDYGQGANIYSSLNSSGDASFISRPAFFNQNFPNSPWALNFASL